MRVAQQVGMQAVADNAIAFHMVDSMPRVLPAALVPSTRPCCGRPAPMPRSPPVAVRLFPTLIDSVQDPDGHVVMRAPGIDLRRLRGCVEAPDHHRQTAAARRPGQCVPVGHR